MSRWRVALPALVLVFVAAVQMVLARTASLSPWKGGGFGMFATTDGTAFRKVRVFLEAPGRSEEIDIAPSLSDAATRVGLFPTDGLLTDFAEAVVMREYRHGRPVDVVRVEVSRVDFEGEPLKAIERRLRSFMLVVPRRAH